MAKRKNPSDLTLRNSRAMKRQLAVLRLEQRLWVRRVKALEHTMTTVLSALPDRKGRL